MEDVRIILTGLWIATMLTYLWGDVIRIYAGDMIPGDLGGVQGTQAMWIGIALLMVTPILMIVISLILPYSVCRWANIIVAIFWIGFNLIGLPTYPTAYDKILLIISMGFNVITIWYAWKWV